MKRKGYIVLVLLLLTISGYAQILSPVKWSYAAKKISANEAILYFKASVQDRWHIFSVNQKDGGPLKTSFDFTASSGFSVIDKIIEPKPVSKFEEVFGMMVYYFEKDVLFQQKIKLKKLNPVVKGKIEYMACTDQQCTPPLEIEFSIPVK